MQAQTIRFRTTRDPRSHMPVPTAASIHAARQDARHAQILLEVLRGATGRRSFGHLRRSLRELLDITAESRDAQVQRRLVARGKAGDPAGAAREYNRLLGVLRSRERAATAHLAHHLLSDVGTNRLRRLNRDLSALGAALAGVDVPRLAVRHCRRALRHTEESLAGKVPTGRRMHPLRIRIRRARELLSLLDAPPGTEAEHLDELLNKMQNALGDLRDSMLLERWVEERGLPLTPQLRSGLDTLEERCRRRCRRHRRPLRHAVRSFLRELRR